jgi:hypothetical protein
MKSAEIHAIVFLALVGKFFMTISVQGKSKLNVSQGFDNFLIVSLYSKFPIVFFFM